MVVGICAVKKDKGDLYPRGFITNVHSDVQGGILAHIYFLFCDVCEASFLLVCRWT